MGQIVLAQQTAVALRGQLGTQWQEATAAAAVAETTLAQVVQAALVVLVAAAAALVEEGPLLAALVGLAVMAACLWWHSDEKALSPITGPLDPCPAFGIRPDV